MRISFCLFCLIIASCCCSAQVPSPYGIVNNGSTYSLAQIDPATGTSSVIAIVPGVSSYVLGNKHCISAHDSVYSFVGFDGSDARLYSMSLQNGLLLSNPPFNGVIVGLRYNCNDSSIYALQDTGGRLDFVHVDRQSGIRTTLALVGNAISYVGETFVIDSKRNVYHFKGFDGPDPKLYTIDISTGNTLASPIFSDNVTALSFNCTDSLIYGLWEDNNQYKVEIVDPVSGTHATIGALSNVTPGIIVESATITESGEFTYAGFDGGNNASLITFDAPSANTIHNSNATINYSGLDQVVCCLGSGITTNLKGDSTDPEFFVFPNPSDGKIFIRSSNSGRFLRYRLLDIYGKLLFTESAVDLNTVIVPEWVSPGLYFLVRDDNSRSVSRKIILN